MKVKDVQTVLDILCAYIKQSDDQELIQELYNMQRSLFKVRWI